MCWLRDQRYNHNDLFVFETYTKFQELQNYINAQNRTNDTLKQDIETFKEELEDQGYVERIRSLEEQLKSAQPSAEHCLLIDQITAQLKSVGMTIERKTKTLEGFHAFSSTCSTTCSSPSEDVSVRGSGDMLDGADRSPFKSLKMDGPFDEIQRVFEKLAKHNRIEEATVKRATDLEMQVNGIKGNYNVSKQKKNISQP